MADTIKKSRLKKKNSTVGKVLECLLLAILPQWACLLLEWIRR